MLSADRHVEKWREEFRRQRIRRNLSVIAVAVLIGFPLSYVAGRMAYDLNIKLATWIGFAEASAELLASIAGFLPFMFVDGISAVVASRRVAAIAKDLGVED